MKTDVVYSSASEDWETPPDLFQYLNKEWAFTLDACASPGNFLCKYFFTKEEDALTRVWTGRVWCNPPYGHGIGKWVRKAADSSLGGATVVMLIPARTDTKWFHEIIIPEASEVHFICGRLRFSGATINAPFPSMVVVFNPPGDRPTYPVFDTMDRNPE